MPLRWTEFLSNTTPVVVRVVLGLIFIAASMDKILHPGAFAQAIENYQILPGFLVNSAAVILPWLEVVLGCCLILGWWLPGVVALVNTLLLVFLGALLFNISRGLDVQCGCFSTGKGTPGHGAWYVLRDMLFLAMGGYLFFLVFLKRKRGVREFLSGCRTGG